MYRRDELLVVVDVDAVEEIDGVVVDGSVAMYDWEDMLEFIEGDVGGKWSVLKVHKVVAGRKEEWNTLSVKKIVGLKNSRPYF